jgi:hypothetical protein
MNLPNQAAPVRRGVSGACLAEVQQGGCSVIDWIACAGVVAGCVAACAAGPAACVACMGGAYDRCKDCL